MDSKTQARSAVLFSHSEPERKRWQSELREDRDRFLHERLKVALWICLLTTPLIELTEVLTRTFRIAAEYEAVPLNPRWMMLVQLAYLAAFIACLNTRLVRRNVLKAACFFAVELAAATALAGIERGDAAVAPVLLLVLTLGGGILFPWGTIAQLLLVVFVTSCVAINLVVVETPAALLQPLFWALELGLLVSVAIAHWLEATRTSLVIENQRRRLAESELRKANEGLERRVGERTRSLRDANRRLATEIEERKKFESRAQQAQAVAEAANRAKSRFLATMSHELRTPLNVTIGASDMLLDSPLGPEQADLVRTIRRSGGDLHNLINDLLDLTRIEAEKITLQACDFSLRDLAGGVCRTFEAQAALKSLSLKLAVASEVPKMLRGDPQRVGQILNNFVSNSIKFTDAGAIEIAIECRGERRGSAIIRFVVDDSGSGVPPADRERVFQPFVQLDDAESFSQPGIGLGLAITRQLAEVMDGEVGVDESPAGGARFWFEAAFEAARGQIPPGAGSRPPVLSEPPGPAKESRGADHDVDE